MSVQILETGMISQLHLLQKYPLCIWQCEDYFPNKLKKLNAGRQVETLETLGIGWVWHFILEQSLDNKELLTRKNNSQQKPVCIPALLPIPLRTTREKTGEVKTFPSSNLSCLLACCYYNKSKPIPTNFSQLWHRFLELKELSQVPFKNNEENR